MPKYIVTVVSETEYTIKAPSLSEALRKVSLYRHAWPDDPQPEMTQKEYMKVKEVGNG